VQILFFDATARSQIVGAIPVREKRTFAMVTWNLARFVKETEKTLACVGLKLDQARALSVPPLAHAPRHRAH